MFFISCPSELSDAHEKVTAILRGLLPSFASSRFARWNSSKYISAMGADALPLPTCVVRIALYLPSFERFRHNETILSTTALTCSGLSSYTPESIRSSTSSGGILAIYLAISSSFHFGYFPFSSSGNNFSLITLLLSVFSKSTLKPSTL